MNNRLQKKCFIAASGFHLALMGMLLFGSAFFNRSEHFENQPLLEFIPMMTTDDARSGGGSPTARPPAPSQPQSQPEQTRAVDPPQRKPDVTPEPPKPDRRDPDALEVKPKKDLPKISLNEVTRNKDKSKPKTASSDSNAQAEAKEKQARQAAFLSAANSIRSGVSGSTEVQMAGPGGGGPTYANFFAAVKKVYTEAWILPDGSADDDATVLASVTISKNGDVISYKVTQPSGNAQIDRSVQMTLERVRTVVPLPESAKESQRTVTITFSARMKRGLG